MRERGRGIPTTPPTDNGEMTAPIISLRDIGTPPSDEPRTARTLRALTTALLELLEHKDLNDIGVAELCRVADVHRTTFYGHYRGIEELAADIFGRIVDRLATVDVSRDHLDQPAVVSASYQESLRQILAHVSDERAAYRALFLAKNDAGFRRILVSTLHRRISIAMDVWREAGIEVSPAGTADIAAAYFAGGTMASIEQWALGDDTDADAYAAAVMSLLPAWWPTPISA